MGKTNGVAVRLPQQASCQFSLYMPQISSSMWRRQWRSDQLHQRCWNHPNKYFEVLSVFPKEDQCFHYDSNAIVKAQFVWPREESTGNKDTESVPHSLVIITPVCNQCWQKLWGIASQTSPWLHSDSAHITEAFTPVLGWSRAAIEWGRETWPCWYNQDKRVILAPNEKCTSA